MRDWLLLWTVPRIGSRPGVLKLRGVELDESALRFLSERLAIPACHSIGQVLPLQDIVCAKSVLEHIEDPSAFISQIGERMSPDGCLFLSMPNGAEYERIGATLGRIPIGLRASKLLHEWYVEPPTCAQRVSPRTLLGIKSTGDKSTPQDRYVPRASAIAADRAKQLVSVVKRQSYTGRSGSTRQRSSSGLSV